MEKVGVKVEKSWSVVMFSSIRLTAKWGSKQKNLDQFDRGGRIAEKSRVLSLI